MHHIGLFSHNDDGWKLAKTESSNQIEAVTAMRDFLNEAITKLCTDNDLSKGKVYTVYCMKFDLEYVAPTGVRLKGLRPFGHVIGNKANLELSIAHLKQVGLNGVDDYDKGRDAVISIPSLHSDRMLAGNFFSNMPWLTVKESTASGVNKSTAETWKQYDEVQRKELLKHLRC